MNLIRSWILDNLLWILLGIGTIYSFEHLNSNKEKLRLKKAHCAILALLHTILGVMCVKLFAIIEVGFDFEKAGNMSIYGGMYLMPVFYFLFAKISKRSVKDTFDVFAICMLFTLLCARFNCIFSGCCIGKPLVKGSNICWPTRQLEIVFYIILIFILKKKMKTENVSGKVFPIYMISYGIFRFIIESVRVGTPVLFGVFHLAHIWSIIAVVLGVLIYNRISKKEMKNNILK